MKKLFILCFILFTYLSFSQTLVETINLPAGNFWNYSYGMVYVNGKYWISSDYSPDGRRVIKAVNSNGVQVDNLTFDLPWIRESQGLAFDGTDFWYVERKTARCDLYKVSTTGVISDSIPTAELFGGATNIYLGGAAWDGSGLWISVYYPDARVALYKVNVAARAIVDTISVAGLQPTGITVKGDTLFYVMDGFQNDDEKIYAIDLNTENTLFSFHVPETPGIRQNPRGLAWDGTYFWLVAEPVGASSGRQLFKYDLGGSGTPHILVSTNTIYFPNTTVGNTSNYNLIIYSNGTATLRIDSIKVIGNNFSINPLSFPINIPAGSSQTVVVNFTPLNYAYYNGMLKIYCNDPVNLVVDINLKGQGVLSGARIGLSATSHNFGNVWVGQEGIAFWNFNIFNMGDQTLQISDLHFNLPEFTFNSPSIPFQVFSTDTIQLTAYFYPTQTGTYLDTLKITNNDLTNPVAKISMQGTGVFNQYNYGYIFWQYQVPPHGTSSAEPRVEGLKPMNDITGDGIPEVIIATENYWVICLDGAASGNTYPLWMFSSCPNNNNCGSIGSNFEYGVQDAIQIADDLNGDGFNDVVVAIGGGNEHVYAINGTNGQIIWQYGDDINYSLGDFEAVDVQRDFNGDQRVDVLAIADGNEQGTGYKRAYLFNGTNGNIIWEHYYPGPNPSFGKSIISIDDLNGDNLPDVVIAYGNNGTSDLAVRALNGINGQTLWTRPMILYEPKELLELPLPNGNSDVIAAEYFNRIHRLDGTTGNIIWTYPLGSSAAAIQLSLIQDVNSDQIPDVLVASFAGNGLNCLSGANGAQLWAWQMDYQFGVASIPDINNDGQEDVVAGARYGNFYCLSGKGDSLFFMYSFTNDWMYTVNKMPSVDGNYSVELLAGTKNGKVVCFSGGTVAVPVELSSFSGYASDGKVFLSWSTATETNNQGFEVERKSDESWETIGFVPGSGTTTQLRSYTYVDENILPGKFSYRLKQIDFNGQTEYSDIIEIDVITPSEYSLKQNYPNPFNPSTTISYSIKEKGFVTLKIFDILGNEVKTLVDAAQEAGNYQLEFNAASLASGIYFYTLTAGDFVSTRKMILLK